VCSSAWADVDVTTWGFGSATPDEVRTTWATVFPGSHVVGKGNTLSIKQVVIGKSKFSVRAQFAAVQGKPVLSKVTLDGHGDTATDAFSEITRGFETPSPLNGKQASNVLQYEKDAYTARATFLGSDRMTVVFEKNKTAVASVATPDDTLKSSLVTALEWIGGIAGVLLVLRSFEYVIWWIVGAVLGYILGDWGVGLMLGIICAVIHLVVNYFRRSHGTTYVHFQPSAQDEAGGVELPAINPANGLPMVGGQGGMDMHGNSYGSNLNDPHL
jgi:hypothetical protein